MYTIRISETVRYYEHTSEILAKKIAILYFYQHLQNDTR